MTTYAYSVHNKNTVSKYLELNKYTVVIHLQKKLKKD